jgi:hypothetical protein
MHSKVFLGSTLLFTHPMLTFRFFSGAINILHLELLDSVRPLYERLGASKNATPSILSLARRASVLEFCVVGMRLMLLRTLIVNQQLTMLAIPSRLLTRHLDDAEVTRDALHLVVVEYGVHFLERTIGGLGVEEVDAGDHKGIYGSKDGVCVVGDAVKSDGSYHDD